MVWVICKPWDGFCGSIGGCFGALNNFAKLGFWVYWALGQTEKKKEKRKKSQLMIKCAVALICFQIHIILLRLLFLFINFGLL